LSLDFAEQQAHLLMHLTIPAIWAVVTKQTIDLDKHRGMTAQKARVLRRLLSDVDGQ